MLQAVQLGCAFLALAAVAAAAGKFAPIVPDDAGYALLIAAALLFFLLPNALRRRWKAQDGKEKG